MIIKGPNNLSNKYGGRPGNSWRDRQFTKAEFRLELSESITRATGTPTVVAKFENLKFGTEPAAKFNKLVTATDDLGLLNSDILIELMRPHGKAPNGPGIAHSLYGWFSEALGADNQAQLHHFRLRRGPGNGFELFDKYFWRGEQSINPEDKW